MIISFVTVYRNISTSSDSTFVDGIAVTNLITNASPDMTAIYLIHTMTQQIYKHTTK